MFYHIFFNGRLRLFAFSQGQYSEITPGGWGAAEAGQQQDPKVILINLLS